MTPSTACSVSGETLAASSLSGKQHCSKLAYRKDDHRQGRGDRDASPWSRRPVIPPQVWSASQALKIKHVENCSLPVTHRQPLQGWAQARPAQGQKRLPPLGFPQPERRRYRSTKSPFCKPYAHLHGADHRGLLRPAERQPEGTPLLRDPATPRKPGPGSRHAPKPNLQEHTGAEGHVRQFQGDTVKKIQARKHRKAHNAASLTNLVPGKKAAVEPTQ